jgi:hypothetical protein
VLFLLLRGPKDVVIEHNAGFADDAAIVLAGAEPLSNFVFRNNIVNYGLYGIYGDGKGSGLPAINFYLPGSEIGAHVHRQYLGADALPRGQHGRRHYGRRRLRGRGCQPLRTPRIEPF